ncbi:hemicentin-1 [Lates calcarifer]|uniref:Hemicentin-1 n=2 Tax=Lates calcarifer TaxID=8187 RepID=A0AAJ8BBJ9_LATCA|nr:hemicentin-1 [Lates calcarifer]
MSKSASFARLFMGFILTATGVHASCPIELSPSSVVVKYGDPVSINCSTTVDLVELMGWETTDNPKTLNHSGHLTWTVESTTNWNIHLSCFLTPLPDATFEQCTVTPKFVLYTFPEKISISSSSGSDGVMNVKEEHNFTCHINHVAPVQNLTVRWYKGDKLMHTDAFSSPNKKPENQTSVYSFTPTRQDNGITFRCEAHMDLGPEGPQLNVSSEEKRVTVHFGPDIKCLYSINILEGETLESHCPVEGNPRPSVRWMKDGHGIDPGSPLYRGDAGMYTVKAGGVSVVKKVLIFYGPNLKCPNSYTAVEYVPHNLTCTVEGYPQPNITWYKDREEVSPPENLTRSDAGQYVITASNSLSSDNCTVEITVLYPPSPIVELEDSEVDVGSDVWLKCSSKGNPQPKYSWNYYQTTNVLEESEDGVSRLYIHNATAYNMGSYTCHALNERGNVSKTVRVTVKGAKQECPIKITPDRMVISFNGTGPTATCKQTSTTTTNVKEIYWDVDGSRRTNNESWNADTHEDWNADPVCIATFEGLGTCRKPLNFTLYKTPDSVLLHPCLQLDLSERGRSVPAAV